ncbi:hypothetical protein MGYG_00626 [Nannizzia gypsea CBS 118893]|uniref:Uncharacterized protein n=1 Tax=Arthroderma gypseum (strain ATCC MYA-4604 / CBS 118893) TaxID=535722 RepID=E5R0T0_ARTGP|nr:hypothetical protein MGYG_00626 [Nannizzia gypsea CBS 118893]EFQ97586.1 hypothetical protein MGYG_00626 [Nannizzia gypsea CBS 118893]
MAVALRDKESHRLNEEATQSIRTINEWEEALEERDNYLRREMQCLKTLFMSRLSLASSMLRWTGTCERCRNPARNARSWLKDILNNNLTSHILRAFEESSQHVDSSRSSLDS